MAESSRGIWRVSTLWWTDEQTGVGVGGEIYVDVEQIRVICKSEAKKRITVDDAG